MSFQIYLDMRVISFFKERTTSFSDKSYNSYSSFHFKDFLDFFQD